VETKLATAFFIGEHRCYGYRLKPFSLLHSLQLEALESPVITGKGTIRPAHLIIAAQICSTHEVITTYARARWRNMRHRLADELARFDCYLANCEQGPELYERPDNGGGKLKCPWQQTIVTSLIRKTSIRREEAWRMPVGQALWQFHSLAEQESDHSLIRNEQDAEDEAEHLRQIESGEWDDRIAAFKEYNERIAAGTWPLDDRGLPIPFTHENLRPL
jgi:hypothetical protein